MEITGTEDQVITRHHHVFWTTVGVTDTWLHDHLDALERRGYRVASVVADHSRAADGDGNRPMLWTMVKL